MAHVATLLRRGVRRSEDIMGTPLHATEPYTCATCEIAITGRPTFHVGMPFCCSGCAADGPCSCSYEPDGTDERSVRHCLDVADVFGTVTLPTIRREALAARR